MHHLQPLSFHVILFLLLSLSCDSQKSSETANTSKTDKPNIVFIFADDLGYADIGTYGAIGYSTPNIDSLASQGLSFMDFYIPASVCTPARAALLTGSYPKRVGLHEKVIFPYSTTGLNPEEVIIPELLKTAGYTSACIGKWHLGHEPEFMPVSQGFDYFYGVPYSNDMDGYLYKNPPFQSPPLPLYRNNKVVSEGLNQDSLTIMWTEATTDFIKNNTDRPFFLYLAHNMPHVPWHVSDKYRDSSEKGLYGDVIQELDWSVGEIMKTLKKLDMEDNTIVVFTSDNGPYLAVENSGSAYQLRGGKASTWEGGFRVPCIVKWPSIIEPGSVSQKMTNIMDFLPTFSEAAGISSDAQEELLKHHKIDGQSMIPLFYDSESEDYHPNDLYYYGRNGDLEAIRSGHWKYFSHHFVFSEGKLQEVSELYDLSSDIGESKNLANAYPEIVKNMREKLSSFDKTISEEARPVGRVE